MAALYPLITDGLALVAYAATHRLGNGGRRYAWTIVILAAALSGLAQASYLAGGMETTPPWLRFGVGAWPATATAIVAHLLYLLCVRSHVQRVHDDHAERLNVQPAPDKAGNALSYTLDALSNGRPDIASDTPTKGFATAAAEPLIEPARASLDSLPQAGGAARRARVAALAHQREHGTLPSSRALAELANVSRSTAGTILKQLRDEPETITTTAQKHQQNGSPR
jgi:hypothetical protein